MKKIMTWIITAGVFLLAVIVVLALSRPAQATGRPGTTNPNPAPAPTPTTYSAPAGNDAETWKYVLGGAVLTCAIVSIWNQRWCWQDEDPGPTVKSTQDNDVTPANLSDRKRTYIIEAH